MFTRRHGGVDRRLRNSRRFIFLLLSLFMVWASIAMAKMLTILFDNSFFNPGGEHGVYIMNYAENIIGEPGLLIILAITAVFFSSFIILYTSSLTNNLGNPKISHGGSSG